MSQYVQHISGQGEKWEVRNESCADNVWRVHQKDNPTLSHFLPKSEYRLCDPPERWVDVTEECRFQEGWNEIIYAPSTRRGKTRLFGTKCADGYRLRKVQLYEQGAGGTFCPKPQAAFIVEKKES